MNGGQATAQSVIEFAIPIRVNLLILCLTSLASVACLIGASRATGMWIVVVCVVAFSYTANTLFALLHEAVHGILHPNAAWNRWGGRLAAAFFPTSLSVQRAYHLTHHRNNRSELERFDYLQPGESRWLKCAQWYSILTGFYWFVSVLGLLIYLLVPQLLRKRVLRRAGSRLAQQTAARAYLATLDAIDPTTARLEILLSIAFQVLLFVTLDLRPGAWLLCYAAFAFQWSALQYADHAYSPLDTRNGAWNLRVNAFTRAMFLNYHHHLAHHRHPLVPWIHLGRLIDPAEPRPSYARMWLSMWRGPRPLPAATK